MAIDLVLRRRMARTKTMWWKPWKIRRVLRDATGSSWGWTGKAIHTTTSWQLLGSVVTCDAKVVEASADFGSLFVEAWLQKV